MTTTLRDELRKPLVSALRFAASRSAITAEEEKQIMAAFDAALTEPGEAGELVERLERTYPVATNRTVQTITAGPMQSTVAAPVVNYTNPDGPAAATLIRQQAAQIASLTARVEGLREALAPFAVVADEYDDREDDDFEVWKDAGPIRTIRSTFKLGMYRNARLALKGDE